MVGGGEVAACLFLSSIRTSSTRPPVLRILSSQVVFTLLGVAGVAMAVAGLPGPGAIILGGSLAMSSTAVAIQVGEGFCILGVTEHVVWTARTAKTKVLGTARLT